MQTYFLFGKYSSESFKAMGAERTRKALQIIGKSGGRVESIHALLGEHDLVLICKFPNNESAMEASLRLIRLTGISFSTSPAIPVEQFDRLITGMKKS